MRALTGGTVSIFTYKHGLLSRVAHDLRIRVDRFEIRPSDWGPEGAAVTAEFYPESFRVEGAMRQGELAPDSLSASDKRQIEDTLTRTILRSAPVRFDGTARAEGSSYRVEGALELARNTANISFLLMKADSCQLTGALELAPSRWGIEPYSALLGAIKLQDRVRVVFELPLPEPS
ncbi:MAG: hypothetical protein OZ921_11630 [Sorangiineae bacterium]|nr:hypothetical protein [Polyangiaceae bacterium]MEB2323157.1 hypothetical protein [Sorangiineae bacterium]